MIKSLKKIYSGKVRDLYEIDNDSMLMVASDRLSAFDVILTDPIPNKGKMLTAISNFWFNKLDHILPNHLIKHDIYEILPKDEADLFRNRAVICKKLTPIKIEAIIRGYLTGSGLKDYQATGKICGITLPSGLVEASKLDMPLFTPSSKENIGDHDVNISYTECELRIGAELTAKIKEKATILYQEAAHYALNKGIIICDTKFEFGLDKNGTLTLMDELLTPDSSRFWPVNGYCEGKIQPSFDKQFIRNWLEQSGWNKKAPAPTIPQHIIQKTAGKYQEVLDLLIE